MSNLFFNSNLNAPRMWFEKIIEVRQVTKVGKGKKRLSFRVVVIIGNKSGQVGVGIGKASDVLSAKLKGISKAQKNIIRIGLSSSQTIVKSVFGKFKKSFILLKPAMAGTGLRASLTIRTIFELVGIKNISSKQLGSNNILNNAYATFNALQQLI